MSCLRSSEDRARTVLHAAERSVGLELADGVIEAVQGHRAPSDRPTAARGHHARHHLITACTYTSVLGQRQLPGWD
jgi:hypothetical protein